jgi:hypothetical protein
MKDAEFRMLSAMLKAGLKRKPTFVCAGHSVRGA